jgi:hypothetical protein
LLLLNPQSSVSFVLGKGAGRVVLNSQHAREQAAAPSTSSFLIDISISIHYYPTPVLKIREFVYENLRTAISSSEKLMLVVNANHLSRSTAHSCGGGG